MPKQRPSFFPVPEHLLPKIHVTPEQHEELRSYMLQMRQEVLREGPTWGRANVDAVRHDKWKLVSSTRDSCFLMKSSGKSYSSYDYRNKMTEKELKRSTMHTPPTAGQSFMGHSKVPYSLEDVMTSAYCETTEEARARYATTYGSSYLDGCVLQTLERATIDDPFWYLGLKWLALKASMTKLVSPREIVFVEHSGTHVQRDGTRMLYRILQSVNIRGYGGKDSYFGLIRGHIEAAFVYWAHNDDKDTGNPETIKPNPPSANMCGKGRVHLKGSLPLWLVQFLINNLWDFERTLSPDESNSSRVHTDSEGYTSSLSSSSSSSSESRDAFDMATQWVPNEDRTTCYVCQRPFQLVRRPKHHCRACGEVICSECTSHCPLHVRPLRVHKPRTMSRLELRSLEAMEAAHRKRMKIRAPKHSFDASAPYITMGKVCHRCIDMKSIMRINSVAILGERASSIEGDYDDDNLDETQDIVWKHDDGEKLRTLTPAQDQLEGEDETQRRRRRRHRAQSVEDHRRLMLLRGRESSLTSSEIRAIIDNTDENEDDDRDVDALKREGDDDPDEDDLEYHPMLMTPPNLVLLDDDDKQHEHPRRESLSGFDPDHLFEFAEHLSSVDARGLGLRIVGAVVTSFAVVDVVVYRGLYRVARASAPPSSRAPHVADAFEGALGVDTLEDLVDDVHVVALAVRPWQFVHPGRQERDR
uniref:FYVE-type domain-containing protein n=1 Tax=Globisporangium ultimum (strain ATCC 200006 / CBS 805.95 / DAOM BR144) TaxID=431595 RepID=K3WAI6_GLOUD